MQLFTVGEHHRGPGVSWSSGRFKVFEGKGERGGQPGVFGQPPGEGIILSCVPDDDADFLFSDQGEQPGKVAGGRIG